MIATLLIVCIIAFFTSFFIIYFKDLRGYLKNILLKIAKTFALVWKYCVKFFKNVGKVFLVIFSFLKKMFQGVNKKEQKEDNNTDKKHKKGKQSKEKRGKDKNSGRVEKQFSATRPVLLPPEEVVTENNNMDENVQENDEKVIKNVKEEPKNIENEEIEEQNEAISVTKPKAMPSMQYRFSNKNFNKNVQEENKKKNLKNELDEILRQARKNMPSKSPREENDLFSKKDSEMPSRMSAFSGDEEIFRDVRQSPIDNIFAEKRYHFETQKMQNSSDSIPLNDFNLNNLPSSVKKKIILAYFSGEFSD